MASTELLLGWAFIGAVAYILGVYTTVPAKAKGGARRGAGGAKRVLSFRSLGIPVGFLGGLAVGPWVIAMLAGIFGGLLGGFAGGVALSGLDLTTSEMAFAGILAAATFIALSKIGSEGDDD